MYRLGLGLAVHPSLSAHVACILYRMACACISVQLRKHCSAAVQLPKLFHRGCWATFEAACALLFVLVMDADKYGPCPLPMPQLWVLAHIG